MCTICTVMGFIKALFGNCLIFLVELVAYDEDRSSDRLYFGAFPQLFCGVRNKQQSHVRSLRALPHISYFHSSLHSICYKLVSGYHTVQWVRKQGNENGRGLNDHLRDGQFKSLYIN